MITKKIEEINIIVDGQRRFARLFLLMIDRGYQYFKSGYCDEFNDKLRIDLYSIENNRHEPVDSDYRFISIYKREAGL